MDRKTLDRLTEELDAKEAMEKRWFLQKQEEDPEEEEELPRRPPGDYFSVAEDPWGIQMKEVFDDLDDANRFVQLVLRANKGKQIDPPSIWTVNVDENGVEGKKSPVIYM